MVESEITGHTEPIVDIEGNRDGGGWKLVSDA
jgi:hypothetical protein